MIHKFDYILLILLLTLVLLGLLTLNSAVETLKGGEALLKKQIVWVLIGILIGFVVYRTNYRILIEISPILFVGAILMLIVVLIFGNKIHGARSWINLFGFTLQPSEPAKVVVVLIFANIVKRYKENVLDLGILLKIGVYLLVPLILILLQPDFGTASTYMAMICGGLFVLGLPKKVIVLGIIAVLLTSTLSWNFLFKNYQKERIFTFFNPERDRLGHGYQVIQAKVAVGSGQLFGKGYKLGTQSRLKYLPEPETDFIFAVFAEENGLMGVAFVLSLFFLLISRIINIARVAYDKQGMLIAVMVATILFYQVSVSTGMIVGLIPTTGIPLPFFSYGGSSTITYIVMIALVLNIYRRRHISY